MNIRDAMTPIYKTGVGATISRLRAEPGILGFLQVINITDDDLYIQLFNKKQGNMAAFADYSGTVAGTVKGTVDADGVGHLLGVSGATASIIIAGTTSYNSTFTVTVLDGFSFYFTDTWVADDATGTWIEAVTLGSTAPDLPLFVPAGDGVMKGAAQIEMSSKGFYFSGGVSYAVTKEIAGSTAPDSNVEFVAGFVGS